MLEKQSLFCIDTVRLVPVLTSGWIFLVAVMYTQLPDAPATESSASTSGTPAANMVDRVRVQRAMVALRMMSPKTGSRSVSRSIAACILSERFQV